MGIPDEPTVQQAGPEQMNGASSGMRPEQLKRVMENVPKEAFMAAAPMVVAAIGAAIVLGRMRRQSPRLPQQAALGAKIKGHGRKPRNIVRYYSMGLLIAMLERDATRKALIAGLKWARQRA